MDATLTLKHEPEKISIKQLFALLSNLKLSSLFTLIGLLFSIAGSIFLGGRWYQYDATALDLEYPFGLSLAAPMAQNFPFPTLILTHDHGVRAAANGAERVVLHLRQENPTTHGFDTVGQVTAQRAPFKLTWASLPMPTAYAQSDGFEWYGYAGNYKFRETFIDQYTVRRRYHDGALLEYKVSAQGRSIPATFTWIHRP